MEEEQDIQSDIVKQKQLRDAQENQEFDREMGAYRRGQKNLTDEERLERMKDITAKRKQLKDNLLSAITTTTNFATDSIEDAKKFEDMRNPLNWGSNIGALGIRAIDSAIPRTPRELMMETAQLVTSGPTGYSAMKLAKEIPMVASGIDKFDKATTAFRTNLKNRILAAIRGDQILPDGTIVKKGSQPLMSKGSDAIDDGYIEEIVEQGDNVIYPPGSKEADILANTKAMASDTYETDLTKFYAGENVTFPVRVLEEVPSDIRRTMAWESGMKDGVFDFERWLSRSLYGKRFRSRTTVSKMQAPHGADVNFESYRDNILLPQFEKEWGPILDKLKIKRSSLQAHHIFAIRASAGLYDGLQFGSKEWVDVTNTLLSKYIRPGDVPKNLMPLVGSTSDVGTPHYITHRYIDELIGPTGETFFTKKVREEMKRNHKFRIKKTEEFAEKMKTAEGVAVQAQKVWDEIYGPGQVIPEKLVEMFSELPMQVNPKYRTDVKLEELVRQVFSQIEEFPFPESMSRKEFIKNWLPQFEGKGFDALRRMFEVDLDLTPEEAMQTPLGYRLQKYLQDRVIRNPIKKKYIKRKKK